MCFLCQSLDPKSDFYDYHGLTGPAADATLDDASAAAGSKPVYTLDQIADQLTTGYWQSGGGDWRAFDVSYGDTLTVNLDGLDATGQAAAMTALAAWTAVSGLQFVTTSASADITFQDHDGGAYAYSAVYTGWNEIAYSVVNVHTSWQNNPDYYVQTYIHEIGHALGLGHGGNYNGSADFNSQAHYANDSWQMSIMSYFGQWENPNVDATGNYLLTPQMADILAIQNLYGTPTNVHTGNSIYGDGTNLTALGMDLDTDYAMTIYDSSGIDVINLGSRGHDQRLSLVDATWSDLDGYIGNFAIARGAVIENAVTGSGDDEVTGNAASNDIQTGAGADTITPGAGDDTITGGAGQDTVVLSGGSEDYDLIWDGSLQVTDIDTTDSSDEGTVTLVGVEYLSFTDGASGTIESDGTVTLVRLYKTGSALTEETLEIDLADLHAWDSIARRFSDTGQWESQINTYDDGQVLEITFTDGQRSLSTMTDTADLYGWESYSNAYDQNGNLTANSYVWDSGKSVDTYFATDGARTGSLVTDGGDEFTWTSIARTYDANGLLAEQVNTFDNGTIQVISYSDGARSAISLTDGPDTAAWASYTDIFDTTTGERILREMTYDDGLNVEIGYEDGAMDSHVLTDSADSFVWSTITRDWDADGNLESWVNTYDDGRVLDIDYTDGVRSSSVMTDVSDAYAWNTSTETYDTNGNLVERVILWDNGTEDITSFAVA